MVSSTKPHCILMFVILFVLVLFASALDVSYAEAEAPPPRAGRANGFLPLAEKHVVVHNVIFGGQVLNIHCKSSEDDLGMIHIPWNQYWDFRFRVNLSKTTKFRCHLTWYGGGSHYFDIFNVARDDSATGKFPVCKECIWAVGSDDNHPMCRINRDGSPPYCFVWDD